MVTCRRLDCCRIPSSTHVSVVFLLPQVQSLLIWRCFLCQEKYSRVWGLYEWDPSSECKRVQSLSGRICATWSFRLIIFGRLMFWEFRLRSTPSICTSILELISRFIAWEENYMTNSHHSTFQCPTCYLHLLPFEGLLLILHHHRRLRHHTRHQKTRHQIISDYWLSWVSHRFSILNCRCSQSQQLWDQNLSTICSFLIQLFFIVQIYFLHFRTPSLLLLRPTDFQTSSHLLDSCSRSKPDNTWLCTSCAACW